MSAFHNVVLVGATGTLGSAIFAALKNSSFDVTVVAREGSKSTSELPSGTSVVTADYSSHDSLVSAFKGADVVVSALASVAIASQTKLIDAAVEAGVKRFMPSEFGADTFNEKGRKLPVYRAKIAVTDYLQEMAKEGKIEWTAVLGGPFLDWGLKGGLFGFTFAEKKATLFDQGKNHVSTTALSDYGQAVVGILEHPSETRNKPIYVQSTCTTQLELLEIIEKQAGASYEKIEASTAEMEQQAFDKMKKGDMSGMRGFLTRAIFGEGYGCDFRGRVSNELVGVHELDQGGLEGLVKNAMK